MTSRKAFEKTEKTIPYTMDNDYTHISFLLDKSSSMGNKSSEVRESLSSFIKEQKKMKSKMTFTLWSFSDNISKIYDFKDIQSIDNEVNYYPLGMTALLDSMGEIIDDTGEKLAAIEESKRPGKVLIVILTDGQENNSKKLNRENIKEKVSRQQNQYNWEFLYLGCSEEQIQDAKKIGILNTFAYQDTPDGLRRCVNAFSMSTNVYRASNDNFNI